MGFLHPWFLLLGLGIIIPVLVHLLNFHRYKQVLFTNVKFLQNLFVEKKQSNKLYERLLLLFRCLTVIFLAILFAQPYVNIDKQSLKNASNNAVVIVLDNSFSMQNISSNGSLLDKAKAKAEEILKEYSDSDVFCLLTMDIEGRHKHFLDKRHFMQYLKEVDVTSSFAMYSQMINTAHHLLSQRNEEQKSMFFISDMQKSCFDVNNMKYDSTIHDVFIPLEAKNLGNIYVDSISFKKNIYLKGEKVDMTVRIRSCDSKTREKQSIKLYVNGKQQSLQVVDVPENSFVNVPISFTLQDTGILSCKIHIMDNPITYDDDFFFVIHVGNRMKVLSISEKSPNIYLKHLFDGSFEASLNVMNKDKIDFSKFGDYNVIILDGLKEISSGLAKQINNFREKGGSIVVVPGKDINIESYHQAMNIMKMPYFSSLVKGEVKVVTLDKDNYLFDKVFSSLSDNIQLPQANYYYKISSSSNTSRQDILNFANKDAFLTITSNGTSSGYIFSVSFDEQMSNFVKQSLFVPIIWNIVLYSSKILEPYEFITDNSPVEKAGFIDIENDDKIMEKHAFNYSRLESNMDFLSVKEIDKLLKNSPYKDYNVFNDRKMISSYFAQIERGFDFTLLLIILVSLSLLGEMFVIKKMNK